MKKYFFLLILILSCSTPTQNKNNMVEDININKNLSFDEFKNEIINYVKESGYPDIN